MKLWQQQALTLVFFSTFIGHCFAENIDALLPSCNACHDHKSAAVAETAPYLAGQKESYLAEQIRLFRAGDRVDPQMTALSATLSDEQINALAKYYASQLAPSASKEQDLTSVGANVRARCISCHGRDGITVNDEWPNLAGQKHKYLVKTLQDYRSGARANPVMKVIASELSDEEITAVAEYYSKQ
jgi:cytochrome c553